MKKKIEQGNVAATVALTEDQLRTIIINHINNTGEIKHVLADRAVAYFDWYTTRWDDQKNICKVTFVNTVD